MPELEAPPRDAAGNVVPHDHAGIQSQDGIIRRIPEHWIVPDEKAESGLRLSSMAFKASSGQNGGMSIDLQKQIEEAGLDAKQYVTTPRWVGSLVSTAGAIRAEGFLIGFDPLEENPYHGEVWGKFSKPKQRRLMAIFEWYVPVTGVSVRCP